MLIYITKYNDVSQSIRPISVTYSIELYSSGKIATGLAVVLGYFLGGNHPNPTKKTKTHPLKKI